MVAEQTSPSSQTSQEQKQKLDQLVEKDPEVLFRAQSAFPFRFFPIEVMLNRLKLTVINHVFFMAREVNTLLVSEIVRVDLEESMLLATVKVLDKSMNTQDLIITHLWKQDAQRLRRLIDGLQIAERKEIDLSQIPAPELVTKLEQLGQSRT